MLQRACIADLRRQCMYIFGGFGSKLYTEVQQPMAHAMTSAQERMVMSVGSCGRGPDAMHVIVSTSSTSLNF